MAVTGNPVELDGIGGIPSSASPSPHTSVYNTPRASMPRRSSSRRDISSSTATSHGPTDESSPPPMPYYDPMTHPDEKADESFDEEISPLDPRRFTPTLHASLVSEILNLRRELDSKHELIEDLESNLQSARNEKEDLEGQVSHLEKDRRQLKKQMSQLESGTLSALEELSKDRDDMKKQYTETKVKLDDLQEKFKKKQAESDRTHAAWEKEQDAWSSEKRNNERKLHIAETRLKQAIAELEALHNAQSQLSEHQDDPTRDSGLGDESDTASQASPVRHNRNMSNSSRMSLIRHRFSVQSLNGPDGSKLNGISLADELQLDEEDEDVASEADSEVNSPETIAKQGLVSRVSRFFDEKAKRSSLQEHRRSLHSPVEFAHLKHTENSTKHTDPREKYVDAGVQHEPSESSTAANQSKEQHFEKDKIIYCDSAVQTNDQQSDRVTLIEADEQKLAKPAILVSTGSQTSYESSKAELDPVIEHAPQVTIPTLMKTIFTQTDFEEFEEPKSLSSKHKPAPLTIPSINIVPPPSAPSSPKEPKLPPGTISVDTQTDAGLFMVSVSVQTEEIRIDARLAKLPAHLHPSAISSNPLSSASIPKPVPGKMATLNPGTANKGSLRHISQPTSDDMSGTIATTPLKRLEPRSNTVPTSTAERVEGLRKLLRSSVLGPAFEEKEESVDGEDKADMSDVEQKVAIYSTPSMTSRSLKHLRSMGTSRPSPVPEEKDELDQSPEPVPIDSAMASTQSFASGRSSFDTSNREKDQMKPQVTKANSSKLRRSAIAPHSTAAHRSRTPSIISVGSSSRFSSRSAGPPFPVPDRGSSRKNASSRSEGSSSPTPRSGGIFGTRRRGVIPVSRKDSLRKVRSATTIQRSGSRGKSRSRSRSPPLANQRISPTFATTPVHEATQSRKPRIPRKSADRQLAQRPTSSTKAPELSRASQGTVVDAIAATMVGEWMWKYVRRRTSFGVPESPSEPMGRPGTDGSMNVTGNGVRHKRWVWLSPYERAIMWSSKQPANNNALMGKSGRKLIIQSVLDVRDDTPLPKNHGISEPFNRSILILTPARALKFTAMSKERHYTWLTALSFLAHSPLLTPGSVDLPQQQQQHPLPLQYEHSKQDPPRSRGAGLKRGGIRDSVRIAKDRARPIRTGKADVQQGSIPDIEFEAAFGVTASVPPIPLLPRLSEAQIAAEPPTVPRFSHSHGRNRSLTGPRVPAATLRSLGYKEVPSPSFPISALPSPGSEYTSTRNSIASAATRSTFLDTVGTIRMEAFIEEQNKTLMSHSPFKPTSGGRRSAGTGSSDRAYDNMRLDTLGDDYVIGEKFDPFKDFHR